MFYIKLLIYGADYRYIYALDALLSVVEKSDFIDYKTFYNQELPPDFDKVLTHLVNDGMLEATNYGVRISLKGKRKISRGGYKVSALSVRLAYFLTAVGTIATIVGLILL